MRLDIRRIETLKEGTDAIGNRVRVKVVKNKVAPPFRQSEFDIIYGTGISWSGSVLDVALEDNIIEKSGSYFSFEKERLGQGRANVRGFLDEHPDVLSRITRRIEETQGITISGGNTAPADATPMTPPPADVAEGDDVADEAVAVAEEGAVVAEG